VPRVGKVGIKVEEILNSHVLQFKALIVFENKVKRGGELKRRTVEGSDLTSYSKCRLGGRM
jgi:hypothetical protein